MTNWTHKNKQPHEPRYEPGCIIVFIQEVHRKAAEAAQKVYDESTTQLINLIQEQMLDQHILEINTVHMQPTIEFVGAPENYRKSNFITPLCRALSDTIAANFTFNVARITHNSVT